MQKVVRISPALLSFVLMFAVGICLASPAPGSKASPTKTSTKATNQSSVATKSTAKSTTRSKGKSHVLASVEDLSGTITAVDPSDKEMRLVGSNGVPYDFDLTRTTQLKVSDTNVGLKELPSESHKQATVHFVPTSHGNLAKSIEIATS